MEWTSVNDLREKYLSFFESKGHLRLPSFPLVPQGDKSLLLINSGMAPMKKFFTGEVHLPEVHPYARPRTRWTYRAPRHLLRNARQLLLRRLLQA